ncbi:MAG: hypothetical protein MJZ76_03430 [Bacteroidales bacterium]|nr:hypothetical protein [Bacteroidales bacterium]
MKKIFLLLFVAILFSACKKEENYAEFIPGNWLCQEQNSLIVPTDNFIVMNCAADKLTIGCIKQSVWTESQYTYTVDGKIFALKNENESLQFEIVYASKTKLRMKKGATTYTFLKNDSDFSSYFVGHWKGVVSEGMDAYEVDFQQNDFSYTTTEKTVTGTFALYGEVLVANYQETGENVSSCWLVKMEKKKLKLNSYHSMDNSNNLQIKTYILEQ